MNFINEISKPKNEIEYQCCVDIILSAIKDKIKCKNDLLKIKNKLCEKHKTSLVTNAKLIYCYRKLLKEKKIKKNITVFEIIRKRKIRTSSGIAAVAVLTKPYKCPGNCIFCPTQEKVPKSYINNEPAVMRAILAKYNAYKQIRIRLRGLELAGNPTDKIELIVMGGTFNYLPKRYQIWFILGCFMAVNNYTKNTSFSNYKSLIKSQLTDIQLLEKLKNEQEKNENAKYKIVGLTLETRPDYINKKELKWFRILGCTRVEIGVQSIYDRILKKNNRGHSAKEIIKATKLLKDAGFKINYHMMPNLYGSDMDTDFQMFKDLFNDARFKPDMLKIYPCVVTKYSKLYDIYKDEKYKPYTTEQLIKLIKKIKKIIPEYVRIQRLIRDIPAQNIVGSSKVTNLRQIIQNDKNVKCKCIRCREIRNQVKKNIFIKRYDYKASDGLEIFLQAVDKDNKIYAMLRLRIPSFFYLRNKHWIKYLDSGSIIREVHTFGQMVEIGQKTKDPQHSGLGKKLIKSAENISKKEFGLNKITVISGIGVKKYYQKLGYIRANLNYMIKKI